MARFWVAPCATIALVIAEPAAAAPVSYDCRDSDDIATYLTVEAATQTFKMKGVVRGQTLERATPCDFMRSVVSADSDPKTPDRFSSARCSVAFDHVTGTVAADFAAEADDALLAIAFDPKALTFAVISRFGANVALTETPEMYAVVELARYRQASRNA